MPNVPDVTVNAPVLVAVPPRVVTLILPDTTPLGTVPAIVAEFTVRVAFAPQNVTLVVPTNPLPLLKEVAAKLAAIHEASTCKHPWLLRGERMQESNEFCHVVNRVLKARRTRADLMSKTHNTHLRIAPPLARILSSEFTFFLMASFAPDADLRQQSFGGIMALDSLKSN